MSFKCEFHFIHLAHVFILSILFYCSIAIYAQNEDKEINYQPFIWESEPPADCPFEKSEDIVGIRFKGRSSNYKLADTWYFSWASDGRLYSPYTDGSVPRLDGGMEHSKSYMYPFSTGQAVAEGDNPVDLKIYSLGLTHSPPEPYGGRYPCGSLLYEGVWYYGTYCLAPEGITYFGGEKYNWPWLGPFVGFRISTDYGRTWVESPHTPEKPIFNKKRNDAANINVINNNFINNTTNTCR